MNDRKLYKTFIRVNLKKKQFSIQQLWRLKLKIKILNIEKSFFVTLAKVSPFQTRQLSPHGYDKKYYVTLYVVSKYQKEQF